MSSFIHVPRFIKRIFLIIAVLLLLVNISGFYYHPSFETFLSMYGAGTPGYHHRVSNKADLSKMLHEKGNTNDTTFVEHATREVFYSMFHSDERRIAISENWIMWLTGKFYKPAGRTQNAKLLVKGGAGNCSERTQVLMDIFKLNGLDCRIIALNGHIAQQVLFNGQWMVADPDYGLVYKGDMDQMATAQGLAYADSVLVANRFNEEMRNRYQYFWKTKNDNRLSALNEVSNPRLYIVERVSQWLRWIIPVLLLFICIISLRKNKKITW